MSRLLRRSQIARLGFLLAFSTSLHGCARSDARPLVAIEIEAQENTLDGCTACGCRAKGGVEPGAERQWWVSFGQVTSDGGEGWEAAGASSRCGDGSFDRVSADFGPTLGDPYVVLDLSASAAVRPAGDAELEVLLELRRLSGFDESGRPVYARSQQTRVLGVADEGELALPLLIPDEREKESFRIHEVLLRFRASVLGREPAASYGVLSVSADTPRAEVLLDGGVVGRIEEGAPLILQNVRTGTREVRVRDFSGREAIREVAVEEGATLDVALRVLDLPPDADPLAPIGPNPQGYEEFWRLRDGAMLVEIPAGEFLMGSTEGEGEAHERPQHRVHVSKFLIDKTEVTLRQYRKFAAAEGRPLPPAPGWGIRDDYPAPFILWEEAAAYCEWAGGRLPTEAEWEKAARGTDGRRYSWGDAWDSRFCNSISGGLHQPERPGGSPGCLSPYGALDMLGNMWEWTADLYGESYYAESPARDPAGPDSGRFRVKRGGAWMSQPIWLRASHRVRASPSSRNADHGFRCAHDPPESQP